MAKFTVLLLYPDHLASNYGQETFLAHVQAPTPEEAIESARKIACAKNDLTYPNEGDDFYALFACKGHVSDLTEH